MEHGIEKSLPGEKQVVLRDRTEADPGRRYEAKVAKRQPTREEVKAQLDSKSADITARLESIQNDVFGSSQRLKKVISESPLLPITGALVGGLVVGLIFGGSRTGGQKKGFAISDASDLLVRKVHEAEASGVDPVEAVSRSIDQLMPAQPSRKRQSAGVISTLGGLLVNFAVGQAITYLESRIGSVSKKAGSKSE